MGVVEQPGILDVDVGRSDAVESAVVGLDLGDQLQRSGRVSRGCVDAGDGLLVLDIAVERAAGIDGDLTEFGEGIAIAVSLVQDSKQALPGLGALGMSDEDAAEDRVGLIRVVLLQIDGGQLKL